MVVASEIRELDFCAHAESLRDTWQARALAHTHGRLAAVLLSVLAHCWDDAMPALLRVVFPGFKSIGTPFLCSAGKIAKSGQVCADMVTSDAQIIKMALIYNSEREMEKEFRTLADELKLSDVDRVDLFVALKAWIVCDFRLDPNLDPADPGARRLH